MQEVILTVEKNTQIAAGTYELVLRGDGAGNAAGQFVEVLLEGFTLRRPFGVAECGGDFLKIIYKVVGAGTKAMAGWTPGAALNILTGLGNGFDLSKAQKPLLIGGGIGAAPLYQLAKEFEKKGIEPTVLLGFRNRSEIYYEEEFSRLGKVIVATDDGSYGFHGNVLQYLQANKVIYDYYYACGPQVMLKALQKYSVQGELSLEARMGCGFGACMGCSVRTVHGSKRVCKEGPVFAAGEVLFDD